MTSNDRKEFAYLMAALAEATSQSASKQKIQIYFQALSDLDIGTLQKGVWNVINTRKTATFPKVAEIREAAVGNVEDQALLAFEKVRRAVAEYGAYKTVVFDDPIIHAAIENCGGWLAICEKTLDEWKWFQKDFIKAYTTFSRSGAPETAPELAGRHDIENTSRGLPANEPVLIGDKKKALSWIGGAKKKDKAIDGLIEKIGMEG